MSKRILSLVLALVMLVLAVPVFALPALAAEADPTIKFAVGPTGTTGLNTVGTVVKETTVSKKGYPTPADIEKAGVTLDLDEVIGWYAYDKETDEFYSVKAYYGGYMEATDGLTFYPVTKTTYMQGYYSGRYAGANQPLWTATPPNTGDNNTTYYVNSEISTYIGGWVLGAFKSDVFMPFTQAGDTAYGIFTIKGQTDHTRFGGYYPTSGQMWATSYENTYGETLNNYASAYAFYAVASGTVKITIPAADKADSLLAVVKNGAYVWPSAIAGKTASAASAEKESWGALKYATTTAIYQEANITDTLTLDVKTGDRLYFMLANNSTRAETYFYPTVSYTNITEVPVFPGFTTDFRDNRPALDGAAADPIPYVGNWDYITYTSKTLTGGAPLAKHHKSASGSETWFLRQNDSNYNTFAIYASYPQYEAATNIRAWRAYALGVAAGKVIGTRYTAPYTGSIKVSFDRLLNSQVFAANHKQVTEYAIFVNGEKVWPVNDTGDWYTVSYYGTSVPEEAKEGDTNVIGTLNTNYADTLNATMPGEIEIEAGQTVEFLMHAVNVYEYSEANGLAQAANRYAYCWSGNYVDGTVEYIFRDAPVVQEGIISEFRDNRPDVAGRLANKGDSVAVSYEGNWDYVYYSDGKKLQKPESLVKRYRISNYEMQSWLLPANLDHRNTVFVYSGEEAGADDGGSGMWQKYGMGVIKDKIIGTRYTAERTGNIKVSFDRLLNNYIHNVNRKTVLEYAIYVNGEKVWPVNDTGDWYAVSYYGANIPQSFKDADANVIGEVGTDFSATVNATMPGEIAIEAGQTVEFLLYTASHESYTSGATELTTLTGSNIYAESAGGNYVDGIVTYTKAYPAPTVEAGVRVGGELSIYGQTSNTVPYNGYGVYLNGEKISMNEYYNTQFEVKVAAADADKIQTVQPYYILNGKEIKGKAYEITLNEILGSYADSEDASIAAAADATLKYTAAADVYFNGEATEIPEVAAPKNHDDYVAKGDSIGAVQCPEENKQVEFRGISLLLNDLINIKIVVNGTLPEGASLQIATNENFTTPETVEGKATSDGTGTKFVMEGISAQNWNTDYYIRVVDASGKAISDTLCYSVAAYYGRMIDRAEATDELKAVIKSLMNLYEAVSAN